MIKPFFSIVIPVYNRAEFISYAIESCFEQTFENFELIIVDDGSTDNTADVVSQYTDHRIAYVFQTNSERGAARNHGARIAKGKYVFFLDSDDFLEKSHLQKGFEKLSELRYPEFLFTGISFVDKDKKPLFKSNYCGNTISKSVIIKGNICGSAFFIRKNVLDDFSFSEKRELSGSEDRLLILILSKMYKLNCTNDCTYFLVDHDDRSMASEVERSWKMQYDTFILLLNESKLFDEKEMQQLQSNFIQMVAIKFLICKNYSKGYQWYFKSLNSISSLLSVNSLRLFKYGILYRLRFLVPFSAFFLLVIYSITVLNFFTQDKLRDYDQLFLNEPSNKIAFIDSTINNTFEYKYKAYSFLESPISYLVNSVKPGVSQIANPVYLYEYKNEGFCGQKSQFVAQMAESLGLDYRYIFHVINHVTVEVKSSNGSWYFFDPTNIIKIKPIDNDLDSELYFNHNLLRLGRLVNPSTISNYGEFYYYPVNYDLFWKIAVFNKTAIYIWFLCTPLLLLIVFWWLFKNRKQFN